jgi:hypothetical protein
MGSIIRCHEEILNQISNIPRGLWALVENNNQNNCWILAPHMYTHILSWTGIYMQNSFHPTPLSPTTKDDCDLSNATTQLLVVDVAYD